MKLYELTQNYQNILNLMDNEELETSALVDALKIIEGEFTEKAENICKIIKTIEGENMVLKSEEERLKKRRQKNENTIKSFKQYLEESMKSTGLTKVKGNVFSLGIQNNPPSVQIEDDNIISDDYIIMKQELDKKAMLRALKEGIEIPGATLKQTKSLRIR